MTVVHSSVVATDQPVPVAHSAGPESGFLVDLFDGLAAARIPYCVLRNYEGLPHTLGGSDLDILICAEALDEGAQVLHRIAREHGGRCISRYSVAALVTRFLGHDDNWWGAAVDLFPELSHKSLSYASAEDTLSRATSLGGVMVASDEDTAISAFLKECLAAGRNQQRYEDGAHRACREHRDQLKGTLERYFGCRVAGEWVNYLEGPPDPLKRRQISRRSARVLLFRQLMRHPWRTLRRKVTAMAKCWARVFSPPGIVVTVLGADGAGKTALIDGMRAPLEQALHCTLRYEHLRPNLLPSLARLCGRPVPHGPTTDPHASSPAGLVGSLLRLAYYTIDYCVGYWLKIFPSLVKRPCLWVLDRYFYDYYIDPHRLRVSVPPWIVRLFNLVVPTPDVILCLGASPQVMQRRKPELPIDELTRQVTELRRFCESQPRAVWIDTGQPLKRSIHEALQAIRDRMAARYDNQW